MNPPDEPATLSNGHRDLLARLAREVMSSSAELVTDGHHLYSPERARKGAWNVQRLIPFRDAIGWEDGQGRRARTSVLSSDLIGDCLPLLLEEKQSEYRRVASAAVQAHLAGDYLGEFLSRHSLSTVSGDIDELNRICAKLREQGFDVHPGQPHENESVA
jgi:hypothetical protein